MSILKRLEQFLDEHHIKYQVMTHSPAYTAQEIAAEQHVPGKQLAKVVMVKKNGKPMMTVLPATYKIDFPKLEKLLGGTVEMETEKAFGNLFQGCEVGAEPPFGNLFNLDVWVDTSLSDNKEVVFNGGTHRETIRMKYKDFERLVKPKLASFGKHL